MERHPGGCPGDGDGQFDDTAVVWNAAIGVSLDPAAGDFNGDGVDDVAIARNAGGTWRVVLFDGAGDAWDLGSPTAAFAPRTVGGLAVADFDADGLDDLAIVAGATGMNPQVHVLLQLP